MISNGSKVHYNCKDCKNKAIKGGSCVTVSAVKRNAGFGELWKVPLSFPELSWTKGTVIVNSR